MQPCRASSKMRPAEHARHAVSLQFVHPAAHAGQDAYPVASEYARRCDSVHFAQTKWSISQVAAISSMNASVYLATHSSPSCVVR